jgi:hypothetical protein
MESRPAKKRLMEMGQAVPASRWERGKDSEARVKGIGPRPGEYATANTTKYQND